MLIGWDNLLPEFNLAVNIKRSLFAVWQEYQGLGLLGGMAHATELPRQLLFFFALLIIPLSLLRYLWTFSMLFLGCTGVYFFTKKIIVDGQKNLIFPFLSGLFYLLNLATLQTFFIPFESFVAFYGFLPWLLIVSFNFFLLPTQKNFFSLILVLLLSMSAWYNQTLFIIFCLILSICTMSFLLGHHGNIRNAFKLASVIFLVNAFWFLPTLYFIATNSSVNLNSKINQMATETIFLQNKEFGRLRDVALLKGFLFNSVNPTTNGVFDYMLTPWHTFITNPFITFIGYIVFLIVLVGFITALRKKNALYNAFCTLFVLCLVALAVDAVPFSFFNSIFREHLPLLNQAFRFPYTKFSISTAFLYAIFFGLGLQQIYFYLNKYFSLEKRLHLSVFSVVISLSLILFTFPMFQGHLLYDRERLTLSQEYQELFAFFAKQNPDTRIANFPQETFWGWQFYNFGYGGSGFLWYGISQPMLDRAFDVWSKTDENYYYEIANALYAKNPSQFLQVLNKYQVNWLLIDQNIISPTSPQALFLPELHQLLTTLPTVHKVWQSGNLEVYKVDLITTPNHFVFATSSLPSVNSYNWNDYDKAYADNNNYLIAQDQPLIASNELYPFRSLFSLKTVKEEEYHLTEFPTSLVFTAKIPPTQTASSLTLPSLFSSYHIVPIAIATKKDSRGVSIVVTPLLPQFELDGNTLSQQYSNPILSFFLSSQASNLFPLTLNINGVVNIPLSDATTQVHTTFFTYDQDNTLVVVDKNGHVLGQTSISPSLLSSLPYTKPIQMSIPAANHARTFTVTLPKIDDAYLSFHPAIKTIAPVKNCDKFRTTFVNSQFVKEQTIDALSLTSLNAVACTAFYAPTLPHDIGYALFMKGKNAAGRSLHFWIENVTEHYAPIDTFLPLSKDTATYTFVLPPRDKFGNSYAFHFDNISIGRDTSRNTLYDFSVYPLPYDFLSSIVFQTNPTPSSSLASQAVQASHPNQSLYVVDTSAKTVILSQSFDKGWKAYEIYNPQFLSMLFPFFFGKEIKTHIMVNNWENGWILNNHPLSANRSMLIIIYLPQYLEYTGFLLFLVLLPSYFAWYYKKRLGSA